MPSRDIWKTTNPVQSPLQEQWFIQVSPEWLVSRTSKGLYYCHSATTHFTLLEQIIKYVLDIHPRSSVHNDESFSLLGDIIEVLQHLFHMSRTLTVSLGCACDGQSCDDLSWDPCLCHDYWLGPSDRNWQQQRIISFTKLASHPGWSTTPASFDTSHDGFHLL